MEIVIKSLTYIRDVPIELTREAVSAGALKKGVVVGLLVKPVEDMSKEVLVEVKLKEDCQAALVQAGLKVNIVECNGIYYFDPDWQDYQGSLPCQTNPSIPCVCRCKNGRRPEPGYF
jgi:hypothetical protein